MQSAGSIVAPPALQQGTKRSHIECATASQYPSRATGAGALEALPHALADNARVMPATKVNVARTRRTVAKAVPTHPPLFRRKFNQCWHDVAQSFVALPTATSDRAKPIGSDLAAVARDQPLR